MSRGPRRLKEILERGEFAVTIEYNPPKGTNISSTSMVQYYVDELVCDGFVCRLPGIKRGLDLTTAGRMLMMIQLEMWATL